MYSASACAIFGSGRVAWISRILVFLGISAFRTDFFSLSIGCEPWRSDGTASGTVPLGDLIPGPGTSEPHTYTVSGPRVYFTANDPAGAALWTLVYVGLGSHASYPSPGVHPTDPACWPDPKVVVPIFDALGYEMVDHAGGGRRITTPRLVLLTATSPAWTSFAGTWGETRFVRLGDVTFADGTGPVGPTHRADWRNPVGTVASWTLAR